MLVPLRGLIRKTRVMAAAVSGSGVRSSGSKPNADVSDGQNGLLHSGKDTHGDAADLSYEAAGKALLQLQSNAEAIAKARQMREERRTKAIPNMHKFIQRSGLTMEEIDKLSVIHVSGTKGKGSTCAFCERIFSCHGYKTGLFSSPHLVQVRERIRINGQPISQEMFAQYFWSVYNNLKQTEQQTESGADKQEAGADKQQMPAYFAFLTVLALHVFVKEGVDVAIMEVGIGGQYDSTNVFRVPAVCGVTSLGFDHTNLLGNTIEEIAWNKAGIFKLGRPAITVSQPDAALRVIVDRAQERQNPVYLAKEMSDELLDKLGITLGIAGRKQVENASLAVQLYRMWKRGQAGDSAIATSQEVTSWSDIPQLEVNDLDQTTITALTTCRWPGRAQTLRRGQVTYFLDGAHTKESIEVCVDWFKEASERERASCGGQVARALLFNSTGDRDVEPFLAVLKTCHFDAVAFCPNQISSVDALNPVGQSKSELVLPPKLNPNKRKELIKRTATPKSMLERTELIKSVWDRLMSADTTADTLSSSNVSNSHSSQADATCHDDNNVSTSARVADHNANLTQVEWADRSSTPAKTHSQNAGPSKRLKLLNNSVQEVVSKSSSVDGSNGYTQEVLHCSSNSHLAIQPGHSLQSPQPQYIIQEQRARGYSSSSDQYSSAVPNGQPSPPAASMSYPCILQALTWVTQGRDDLVRPADPNARIQSVPDALKEAEQIHVLVTGSLHLVGGVLRIIDPSMME